jgi:hypothetical protein
VVGAVSLEASAKYDQIVALNIGDVQVYDTDDDIAATVLKNVSPGMSNGYRESPEQATMGVCAWKRSRRAAP